MIKLVPFDSNSESFLTNKKVQILFTNVLEATHYLCNDDLVLENKKGYPYIIVRIDENDNLVLIHNIDEYYEWLNKTSLFSIQYRIDRKKFKASTNFGVYGLGQKYYFNRSLDKIKEYLVRINRKGVNNGKKERSLR